MNVHISSNYKSIDPEMEEERKSRRMGKNLFYKIRNKKTIKSFAFSCKKKKKNGIDSVNK